MKINFLLPNSADRDKIPQMVFRSTKRVNVIFQGNPRTTKYPSSALESAKGVCLSVDIPKMYVRRKTLDYMIIDTVLPAKSDSDFMFCLQSYQGLIIDISLVY